MDAKELKEILQGAMKARNFDSWVQSTVSLIMYRIEAKSKEEGEVRYEKAMKFGTDQLNIGSGGNMSVDGFKEFIGGISLDMMRIASGKA